LLIATVPAIPRPVNRAALDAPPRLTVPPLTVATPMLAPALRLVVPPVTVAVVIAVTFGRLAVPPLTVRVVSPVTGPKLATPPLIVRFGVAPRAVELVTLTVPADIVSELVAVALAAAAPKT